MWNKISVLALVSVLGLGLGATAQNSQKTQNSQKSTSGYTPDKDAQEAMPYGPQQDEQNRIAREVRHQLVMLPYYSVFDDLAFKVEGNTVTLLGATTTPGLKRDAGNVVKRVEGVETVNNQIRELPPSNMDDQIRRATFRAIYSTPQLQRYGWQAVQGIRIIVENGHVTLTGVVDNQADKDVANIRARSVPNVFSVTNDLRVAGNNQQARK
ncbi:MAG TPA: BON domain-containing protein [Terriglobales bacterium]|nr:BON domain-containing protein [Terriglobales bacterium]